MWRFFRIRVGFLERFEGGEGDHIAAVVKRLVAFPGTVEEPDGVLDPVLGELTPAHRADLAVALEVDVEERPLGSQQVLVGNLVVFIGVRRLESTDPEVEALVVVEVDIGVQQVEAGKPAFDRDLILDRLRHPAREVKPGAGHIEAAADRLLVGLLIDVRVHLRQRADLELKLAVVGFEQKPIAAVIIRRLDLDFAEATIPDRLRGVLISDTTTGAASRLFATGGAFLADRPAAADVAAARLGV